MTLAADYFFGQSGREPERRAAFLESMQAVCACRYLIVRSHSDRTTCYADGTGKPSILLKIIVSWFSIEAIPADRPRPPPSPSPAGEVLAGPKLGPPWSLAGVRLDPA